MERLIKVEQVDLGNWKGKEKKAHYYWVNSIHDVTDVLEVLFSFFVKSDLVRLHNDGVLRACGNVFLQSLILCSRLSQDFLCSTTTEYPMISWKDRKKDSKKDKVK